MVSRSLQSRIALLEAAAARHRVAQRPDLSKLTDRQLELLENWFGRHEGVPTDCWRLSPAEAAELAEIEELIE